MRILGTFLLATLVLGIAVSATISARSQQSPNALHGGQLEGTWRVQVSLRNCQTGVELKTFPALLTFGAGGTLVGTSTVLPPSGRSGDVGIWQHDGGDNYSAVSEAFIFAGPAWVQTQRITQAITLSQDANKFSSNAHTEFFDTNGNLVASGCATAAATRMTP